MTEKTVLPAGRRENQGRQEGEFEKRGLQDIPVPELMLLHTKVKVMEGLGAKKDIAVLGVLPQEMHERDNAQINFDGRYRISQFRRKASL